MCVCAALQSLKYLSFFPFLFFREATLYFQWAVIFGVCTTGVCLLLCASVFVLSFLRSLFLVSLRAQLHSFWYAKRAHLHGTVATLNTTGYVNTLLKKKKGNQSLERLVIANLTPQQKAEENTRFYYHCFRHSWTLFAGCHHLCTFFDHPTAPHLRIRPFIGWARHPHSKNNNNKNFFREERYFPLFLYLRPVCACEQLLLYTCHIRISP